ncbi:hypothetical protein ES703_36605 [subsurface metagenome]
MNISRYNQLVFLGIRYDNRDYSFYINVVNPCCIDLLVCRGTNKHIRASVDTAGLFSQKIPFTDSNPTAAYDGFCVQSFFYYDVFLITNQRAISIMLTAFFICTFLLIVFDMLILGRNAPALSLLLCCPYYLSYPVSQLYSFREVKVGKFAEKLSRFIIIGHRCLFLVGKISQMYPLSVKSNSRTPSFISTSPNNTPL